MQKRLMAGMFMVAAIGLLAVAQVATAGDRGPQYATSTVGTNRNTVTIPIGDVERFEPEWLIIRQMPAVATNKIEYVASGVTGTVSAASVDKVIAVTNVPTMFYGDIFLVTPSATDTNGVLSLGTNNLSVRAIGRVFE